MTRDQIITSVMNRLGARTDLQSSCETEILVVMTTLEGHSWLPWFLLTETETNSTVVNEERVQIPTDFLLEDEEQALWRYDASDTDNAWKPLTKDDLDDLREKYPGTGEPLAYALRGNYFVLKPTPDDVYTLKMSFYGQATSLATNVENAWTKYAPELVIQELCLLMARDYIKDYEAVGQFEKGAAREWSRLYKKHISRNETGRMRSMGDE